MIEQALAYFRTDNGYDHLFLLFKKKFQSLGRIGGSVKITTLDDRELESLARFYGSTPTQLKEKGSITLQSFERQLSKTRFYDVTLKELLEAYFNEKLISNKEKKQERIKQQEQFLSQAARQFPALASWLTELQHRRPDSHWIYRLIDLSEREFEEMLVHLNDAITHLPKMHERLPMFSQRITRNPHTFDLNTNLGRLFLHLLSLDRVQSGPVMVPTDSESINELLLSYNILRDDISNYVTCVNLIVRTDKGIHPVWQAASDHHSVMNVPLRELEDIVSAYPANGEHQVWLVENSGVYSSILDHLPAVPLLCTHGQFKLSALILIDQLVQSGCTLHYAGDLDPEGLRMAERLVNRYPNQINLWKMDLISYQKSKSPMNVLTEERLKQLDAIQLRSLLPVKEALAENKIAGYQEALVQEMIAELADLGY
ncbi:TIGR02679 family protein [Amphibacillus sp. MSJ-3]|uniref:TIGR02679 family protein n=1 Tax=Amphibacillus sp. MSJ-3 TaxID=2841505 RepID=UPI001C0F2BD8|nr:TIGR02679 family protein [Amphibacillus sp. MSJ-3]MBU5594333.1 TIGR02679 family protein [Amphibacillus sp. MSJ-3]